MLFRSAYTATVTFWDGKEIVKFPGDNVNTDSMTDSIPALGHVMKTTWTWKGIDKDGQEIEITDGDAEQTEKESAVVEYTAATASTKCQYEAEAEPEVEEAVVSVKYENDNSTVDCEHEVIAYYTATVSGKSDRKTVVIPQLKHNYDWKLNKDWNEIGRAHV